ncbi:MAG: beta-ketoacyl-ACP synthase II, partial [Proteobacteria bacterium]
MNAPRRVVVTGFGAVSPLGLSAATTWSGIREGRSGIAGITLFDVTDCPVKFAGEVKGFDAAPMLEKLYPAKDLRKVGRFAHLSLAASLEAFEHSGLVKGEFNAARAGTAIGVGMGGLPEIEDTHNDFKAKGFRRISPFFITQSIPNLASGMVSMAFGLKGSNLCHTTACASGAHAIGESFLSIRNGQNDVVLAGGAESVVCALGVGGFAALRALSTRNDDPKAASRPYDNDRDGFVLAEGATTLVLEEYEHAKKRGATIYAEIVGYGLSGDAYHFTLPAPEGAGGGQ